MSDKAEIQVDLEKTFVTSHLIGVGITTFVLSSLEFPIPLGLVWGIGWEAKPRRFDVYGSFVPKWARRNGIRRKINESIFVLYDVITSGDGTPVGRKFMRSEGYTFDETMHLWVKKKPKPKN